MSVNESQTSDKNELSAIAATIKEKRLRLGLTVDQLASKSSVSSGALSQLERAIGNPSYSTLSRLANALSLPLSDLVSAGAARSTGVVRLGDRRELEPLDENSERAGLQRALLTPSLHAPLQVIETVLPVGFSNSERPFRRIGMECAIVQSGDVRIFVGDQSYQLAAGDALTYDCTKPHWWENIGNNPATILGVATPMGP